MRHPAALPKTQATLLKIHVHLRPSCYKGFPARVHRITDTIQRHIVHWDKNLQ